MVSTLSGFFQFCPRGFNSVRTVLILSGRSKYCPDDFYTVYTVKSVRKVLLSTFICHERWFTCFFICRDRWFTHFFMSREVYLRASSGKFLRVKSCCPESFRFLCLWQYHTIPCITMQHYASPHITMQYHAHCTLQEKGSQWQWEPMLIQSRKAHAGFKILRTLGEGKSFKPH